LRSVGQALFILWILAADFAQAGFIDIRVISYGSVPVATQSIVDNVIQELENEVNATLPQIDGTLYLNSIANANTVSGAGVGADYISPFQFVIVGLSGGLGYDLNGASPSNVQFSDLSTAGGVSGQFALMIGTRLERFSSANFMKRSAVFFHFSNAGMDQGNISFKASSLGFHWQYKLIPDRSWAARSVRWQGLDLTTGYRTSSVSISMTENLSTTYTDTTSVPGASVTGTYQGNLNLAAEAATHTIPLEISSGVRLGYIWTLFSGLGFDLNWGKATSTTLLSGPVSFTSTPSSAFDGVQAEAILDLGQQGIPKSSNLRSFIGIGLELGIATLTFQFTKSMSSKADAVSLGVRAFF